jgi:hypothetical protein
MQLDLDKALQVLQLLAERMSVRATIRVSGVNRTTILALLRQVGDQCEDMMMDRIKDVSVREVQVDEARAKSSAKRRSG